VGKVQGEPLQLTAKRYNRETRTQLEPSMGQSQSEKPPNSCRNAWKAAPICR